MIKRLWANQEKKETKHMSFKPLKTSVALASAATLAAFGLVAAPAQAADGDVSMIPKTGTGTSAFTTDSFSLTTSIKTSLGLDATNLAYLISNPSQVSLHVDATSGGAEIFGIKADGSLVTAGDFSTDGVQEDFGDDGLFVPFKSLDIVSVLIMDLTADPTATGNDLVIQLAENALTAVGDDTAADPLERGDLLAGASVTVTAWVETGAAADLAAHRSVETAYSSSVVVNFVDPANVSPILTVDRQTGGSGDDGLSKVTDVVRAYLDLGAAALTTQADEDAVLDGVTLVAGDLVLVDTTVAGDNGIWTVAAATAGGNAAVTTANDYVQINEGTVNAGKVIQAAADTIPFTEYATAAAIGNTFNANGDKFLAGTMKFSNSQINLAQVNLAKWQYAVEASNTDDFAFATGAGLRTRISAGNTAVDALGNLAVTLPVADASLNTDATYTMKLRHADLTTTEYKSAAFTVASSPSAGNANFLKATISDTVNSSFDATVGGDVPVALRNGTSAFTYTAQVYVDQTGTGTVQKTANMQMIAVVEAGANFAKGETLIVSGTPTKISTSGGVAISQGTTNSNGQYSVTVTSSDSSSASAVYSVQFYVLDTDVWRTAHEVAGNAKYDANYAASALSTFTSVSTVASGSSVTLEFNLVDQFGSTSSADALGKGYSVQLQAPAVANLDLDAVVVDGTASFTFDNYLVAGGSDVLTASLYTGTATSPTLVSGKTANITLFNTNAATGINVDAKIVDVVVDYTDYITGKTSAAAPGPATGTTYSGTVVDANGSGVPGAPVTISGADMQFLNGTTFAKDSITLNATAAGTFTVTFWTHTASAAGKDITVTSGAATATTKVTSKVQDADGALSAANLLFSWSIPAQPVMNTTYAVVATVTDVWGNPIAGASVLFTGLAAANFNAAATATRATGAAGTATVYLRSIKDVDGLAAISAKLTAVNQNGDVNEDVDDLATVFTTDVATTSWDETTWTQEVSSEITFTKTASAVVAGQKVNAGSFKGYVALYAKGYEGQRMSAKVGNDWVIVAAIPAATNDLFRAVEFVGAGVDISVRIYIDRVLVETIPLLTK
jgi:hypothetical protein